MRVYSEGCPYQTKLHCITRGRVHIFATEKMYYVSDIKTTIATVNNVLMAQRFKKREQTLH